jgi:ribose/xylose/arabinose/galactoside ABC-type transport system permease subunit
VEAARLAGIRVDRNLVIIYSALGVLVSLAAIITTSRLGSGAPSVGNLAELDAIAAVIIGGTSFAGGIGRLGGTAIGVLLIGVINNVLSLLNVTSNMQMIVKGVIIFVAVALDSKVRKR